MQEKERHRENLHVILWLIKDSFWMLEWKLAAVLMIIPTLSMAFWIVFKSKSNYLNLIPNLAVFCWILANAIWMLDEFYFPGTKLFSLIPFISGLILMVYYIFKFYSAKS
ncbi:MAG: hypothetical protein ACOVP1_03520 [Bacteroidia bacterium]